MNIVQGQNATAHPDVLMTTPELADFLQIKPLTAVDWRTKHIGPPWIAVGRLPRYRMSDVQTWLESRVQKGA